MSRTGIASLMLLLALAGSLPSQSVAVEQPLTVATREVPPFAFRDDSGAWQGIAVELWREIAAERGLDFRFEAMSLQAMLDSLANGRVDAAVAALTVTSEREQRFDFTHPFYRSGLGIAVSTRANGGALGLLAGAISPAFLGAVAGLLALLAFVGALVWVFERGRNPQFPPGPLRGIGAGLWWSGVTMTTVGYGDKAPATFGGRLVALVWMFVSVIIISTITAALATTLTLGALSGQVQNEGDLAKVRTGTLAGSTSDQHLTRRGIGFRSFEALDQALDALVAGDLDAVVYDAPLLKFLARSRYAGEIQVLPVTFEPQDYAFGLPAGSTLREPLNRRLLERTRSPDWQTTLTRYLGSD